MQCANCHSLTTDSSMSGAQSKHYYGSGYFNGGDYHAYETSAAFAKSNFRDLTRRLATIQASGALLELGCAYGYFLDEAQGSWKVEGVDISAHAVEQAAGRFGSSVQSGDFMEMEFGSGKYDWIVMWDVIEHLDQPQAYLDKCYSLLRPNGYLALTTGNVTSRAAKLMGKRWRLLTPPSHLTFFSATGMRLILERAGLKSQEIGTAGYRRSLGFTLFRLMGKRLYGALKQRAPRLTQWLDNRSFYANLGDIMFVVAQKPQTG